MKIGGKCYLATKAIISSKTSEVNTCGNHRVEKFVFTTLTSMLKILKRRCFRVVSVTMVLVLWRLWRHYVSSAIYRCFEYKVVSELKKRYLDVSGIFQQDLAPCHMYKIIMEFISTNLIETLSLPWPENSPNFNSIENLLAICSNRLLQMN